MCSQYSRHPRPALDAIPKVSYPPQSRVNVWCILSIRLADHHPPQVQPPASQTKPPTDQRAGTTTLEAHYRPDSGSQQELRQWLPAIGPEILPQRRTRLDAVVKDVENKLHIVSKYPRVDDSLDIKMKSSKGRVGDLAFVGGGVDHKGGDRQ